jgi:two-component system, LytTR family, sensor histidine kinase AlgZ
MSALHPILARKGRLAPFLSLALPLAAVLTGLLARPGAFRFGEAVSLAWLLAFVSLFLYLSVWYISRAAPLRGGRLARTVATHAVAAILISSVWVLTGRGAAQLLTALWGSDFPSRYAAQVPVLFSTGILLYILSLALHSVLLAFEGQREAEQRALELQVLAREAELKALKAQIHPHFLFNSLNSISSLAGTDPGKARAMCLYLSEFLRKSLAFGERKSVPVAEELALARAYLEVEGMRFGSRLSVEEAVESEGESCLVPPLLLQPLVENAVRHGIATTVEGGVIRLEARRTGNRLRILIENPCDPDAPPRRGTGLGLANVRQRLAARYGTEALFAARHLADRYLVVLSLPAQSVE